MYSGKYLANGFYSGAYLTVGSYFVEQSINANNYFQTNEHDYFAVNGDLFVVE